MEAGLLMAMITIIGWVINRATVGGQQEKEYQMQQDLLQQEQDFTAEREDIAFARQQPQNVYRDYLNTGFNPNLAAQSILGGASEVTSTGGSPAAPTTNSALSALQSMTGQSSQQMYDVLKNVAEINNINENTNKTQIEAGIMPRDFFLRQLTVTEQINLWDKTVEKMNAEIGLAKEQTDLVKQQNLYYGRVTTAEINLRQKQAEEAVANAKLALEKVNTEKHAQRNLDADTLLKNAETSTQVSQNALLQIEQVTEYERSERERIAKEFEQKLGGVPLTADGQKYVMKLAYEGKYDEISQFFQLIFTSALSEGVGVNISENAKYHHKGDNKEGYIFLPSKGGILPFANPYNFSPYWNPSF